MKSFNSEHASVGHLEIRWDAVCNLPSMHALRCNIRVAFQQFFVDSFGYSRLSAKKYNQFGIIHDEHYIFKTTFMQ
ncbi:hypothetical protein UFOVP1155_2 [uncultured Caudovirales phage]|uniref:Uncharacterized protein n=1 Tax=uncultured Caudovirales phage TaxID=2100421 RepID=A0A6J5R0R6_9CAUD|nr:hypothetical protein UFOVP1155_2 [uncultured Caudovirales phage]